MRLASTSPNTNTTSSDWCAISARREPISSARRRTRRTRSTSATSRTPRCDEFAPSCCSIAFSQATETKDKFAGLPLGARAVQIADGNTATYFLTTFGRASRETVCSCEVKMEPNLGQALHLMNGENVHSKVKDGGVVKRLLDAKKSPPESCDELYLRCLSRKPTEDEAKAIEDATRC